MVKLVLLLNRRPDLTDEAFSRYWRTTHADCVRGLPYLRRYVISIRTRSLAGEPMPDGIAELWFDDMASLEAATRTDTWLAARQDGNNFRVNSIAFVCEEHEVGIAAGSACGLASIVRT